MERPIIKDASILKYVEYLENQVKNYSSETPIAKLYIATLRQIVNITETFNEMKINKVGMSDKDDKMFDRYFKIQDNVLRMVKDLKEFDTIINPKLVEDLKQEVGSDYEKRLNMLNDGL